MPVLHFLQRKIAITRVSTSTCTFCYGSPEYITNFVQKTIRLKGIGTISKKFKAPEITDADRAKAATEVMKNTIKLAVIDWWKRLEVCS